MGFFDRFKKNVAKDSKVTKVAEVPEASRKKETKEKSIESKKQEVKGGTASLYKKEKTAGKKSSSQAYRLLIKPVVSEKASHLGAFNQYIFEVAPAANKIEIKKAVNNLYNVDVAKVRIITMPGKKIRYGRTQGQTSGWKKAIVTLKPGQKLELYEGV